jgi:hypothetical protein
MMSTVASILDGVGIGRKVTCFTKVVVGAWGFLPVHK